VFISVTIPDAYTSIGIYQNAQLNSENNKVMIGVLISRVVAELIRKGGIRCVSVDKFIAKYESICNVSTG